jgi:hypothetical protein
MPAPKLAFPETEAPAFLGGAKVVRDLYRTPSGTPFKLR